MNVVLWIVTTVLALAFAAAGTLKLTRPKEKLAAQMGWVEDFSPGMVKTIGGLELLAAVGLILPGLTGIAPVLVPLAALGLVALMVGAAITHVRRHEPQLVVVNAVLLVLALVVVWGRLGAYAFTS